MIDYNEIDEEIKSIVKKFNDAGYHTIASCQGHITDEEWDEPYLAFTLPEDLTLLNFVINNLTPTMEISIKDYADIEDMGTDDKGNDIVVLDTYFRRHKGTNKTVVSLYINNFLLGGSDEARFDFLRRKFLIELENMANDVLKCTEAYNELNVRRERS